MTTAEIKARMLTNIPDEYDKSDGEFFSDAISPVAIELGSAHAEQEAILAHAFVDTASGEYLERKCAEMGIKRKVSAKASGLVEIAGAVGASITQGILVASDLISFAITGGKVIGASGKEVVSVECTQFGTIGNVPAGAIRFFPISQEGLSAVTNLSTIKNGYNAESDDDLRTRFYEKVNAPATSGNAGHYKQWAKAVTGVGDAKVFSTWNGAGTVKLSICDANKRAASADLIANTLAYIEAERPIGATVTVESATEKLFNVSVVVVLDGSRTLAEVKLDLEAAMAAHFKSIAFTGSYVSYAKIGSLLYDTSGVVDYSDLRLNGGVTNIALAGTEIPVVGTVVLG